MRSNEVLRCKTPDMLANWLLRFAADARRKEPIGFLAHDGERFRKNLIRVMTVQVVTLLLLGYLQYLFTP